MSRPIAFFTGTLVAGLLIFPPARADMYQPNAFDPAGALLSESGVYQVNTDTGVMTLPAGGTIVGEGGGIFTFGSVDITNASFDVQGSAPFVLLSQGNLSLNHVSIDLDAQGQTPGPGGNAGYGNGADGYLVGAGGGGFGTAGGNGGPFVFTGYPQAAPIWGPYLPGAPGGTTYGGVWGAVEGGSAGGNFYYVEGQWGTGGAGGGAIELGANGTLSLAGTTVSANGGDGSGYGGGGGSGGSISLLGWNVNVDAASSLSAAGGAGAPALIIPGPSGANWGQGGVGGLGRVDIEANQLNFQGTANGVMEVAFVPEPASIVLFPLGIVGVILGRLVRRNAKRTT